MGLAGRWKHIYEHPVEDDNTRGDQWHEIRLDFIVELVLAKEATQLHLVYVE